MSSPPAAVLLRHALRVLVPLSVALTFYLYLYPVFHVCAFPLPPAGSAAAGQTGTGNGLSAYVETLKLHLPFGSPPTHAGPVANGSEAPAPRVAPRLAPFRLLALGDPQLEGDTSIPNAHCEPFPHLASVARLVTFRSRKPSLRERVRQCLHDLVDFYLEDIPNTIESVRKRIDLFGNDFYLAHIYRTLRWWALPTHVTVLGDLLGSQWISDDEFERRADRYWSRVVRGGERLPDDVMAYPSEEYDLAGYVGDIGPEAGVWRRRIINVAGNHDIGYAGDINQERLARFERLFGKANYELRFELPTSALSSAGVASMYNESTNPDSNRLVPELRIVVLNDMNLDTPALSTELQDQTYNFINALINTASAVEYAGQFTLLLTHVPLYKPEGVCVDSPFFAFHDHDGSLKEQNQLSADASRGFLEGIYGLSGDTMAPANGKGRRGVIINGHDHEGCDTLHFVNQSYGQISSEREWQVRRWAQAQEEGIVRRPDMPGLREITVRSMMGGFGGNAGLVSVWFDEDRWEWQFESANCALGKQHTWWLVHILDLVTVAVALAYGATSLFPILLGTSGSPDQGKTQASVADDRVGGNDVVTVSEEDGIGAQKSLQ